MIHYTSYKYVMLVSYVGTTEFGDVILQHIMVRRNESWPEDHSL